MRALSLATLLASLALCGPAFASAALAEAKQCTQCHKMTEEHAGPSFHKIALAHKGERGAVTKLAVTIRLGSDGKRGPHWDAAKMPNMDERPEVSKAEASKLAKWIMKQ